MQLNFVNLKAAYIMQPVASFPNFCHLKNNLKNTIVDTN